MNVQDQRHATSPALGRAALWSLLSHALVLLLFWFLGPTTPEPTMLQIRMVRLAGGGQNRPGWVSETPPGQPVVQPVEESVSPPVEAAKTAPKEDPERPALARTPNPVAQEKNQAPREPQRVPRESESAAQESAVQERRDPGGRANDTGAGARGPGGSRTGAMSDSPQLPGMNQYLLRLENAVQRAFKYPARGSKKRAVFHFLVDRAGRVTNLEQVLESGLPGLDLSGKSAITRAVLPPLPPAFPYEQIGVTFTFVDE